LEGRQLKFVHVSLPAIIYFLLCRRLFLSFISQLLLYDHGVPSRAPRARPCACRSHSCVPAASRSVALKRRHPRRTLQAITVAKSRQGPHHTPSPAPATAAPSRSSDAIVLRSPHQSTSLLQTLRTCPFLVRLVCTLVPPSPSAEDAEVFRMLERLEVLDVTLPNSDSGAVEDLAAAISEPTGPARAHDPQKRGDLSQPARPARAARCAGGCGDDVS
jgi:hypothetical protein